MQVVYCNRDLIEMHLAEAIVMSGFPMRSKMESVYEDIRDWADECPGWDRAKKLGQCAIGTGHDSFLKGVTVSAVIEAPQYWWMQAMRYTHFHIVSSQSKMHRITEMDYPSYDMIGAKEIYERGECTLEELLDCVPMGLKLTAGVTTNYLQLKTMYHQRKSHKLSDWRVDFVEWCECLPLFKEIIGESL